VELAGGFGGPSAGRREGSRAGVTIKQALANGLSDRAEGGHLTCGTTVDALALAPALSQPWADVVLSGAVTTKQLMSNVKSIGLAREAADWPAIAEAGGEVLGAAKRSRVAVSNTAQRQPILT
jgi:aryl-alcohol dehydrogenase-like predicted oxidoreductase